jgi:predicted nuclease of restriction endonuclease-like (RecB) superfamily
MKKSEQKRSAKGQVRLQSDHYSEVLGDVVELLDAARRASARAVNALMTATYWEMGRRIVESEQRGAKRADYGKELIARLSADLTKRFGRGFSERNLEQMRLMYLTWRISQTLPAKSESPAPLRIPQTVSAESGHAVVVHEKMATRTARQLNVLSRLRLLAERFPLPWSHYVRLLSVRNPLARDFYEIEALRGGWSVRQLDRQIGTQFYERTALSRNKEAMLVKGQKRKPADTVSADEEIKDPLLLEFLGLKDEYSESDLEEALICHLETFLLELGGDFTFVARQRRLRIGDRWYRVDLVFFHRALRCIILVDLKLDELNAADVGQMHLYCNYARAHWTRPDENPPVGIILCAKQGEALARYALDGLPNKMLVREYRTSLPKESELATEIARTRELLERRMELRRLARRKSR